MTAATADTLKMLHAAGMPFRTFVVDHRDRFGWYGYVTEYRVIGDYGGYWLRVTDFDPFQIVKYIGEFMADVDERLLLALQHARKSVEGKNGI